MRRMSLLFGLIMAVAAQVVAACETWQLLNPLPVADDLAAVAYGDGVWFAVGEEATILTSTDQVKWEVVDVSFSIDLRGIAWGSGVFAAVGVDGAIIVKDHGSAWQEIGSGIVHNLEAIAYGPPGFVAVGDGGAIVWSQDGAQWLKQESATENDFRAVTWTDDQFVAVGNGGVIFGSEDGHSWSLIDSPVETDLIAVAGHDSILVVLVADNHALRKLPGQGWVVDDLYFDQANVIWCNGKFRTAASDGVHSLLAPGFESWSYYLSWPLLVGLQDLACHPDGVTGVGPGGQIAYGDGEYWRLASAFTEVDFFDVTGDGPDYLAIGGTQSRHELRAGSARELEIIATSGFGYFADHVDFHTVLKHEDLYLAAGSAWDIDFNDNALRYSHDRITWHDVESSREQSGTIRDLIHDGSRFLFVEFRGDLGVSNDGISWEFLRHGNINVSSIASDGTIVVAVGPEGRGRKEELHQYWTVIDDDLQDELNSVAWGNSIFVAVGPEGAILTSADGATWLQQDSGTNVELNHIEWIGDGFLVVGNSGVVLESTDGLEWRQHSDALSHDLLTFTRTDDGIMAFGRDGLVQRLVCTDDAPWADFVWRPHHAVANQPVHFFDVSQGEPTTWGWVFGDGDISGEAAPSHVYSVPGTYAVQLEVSNQNGSSETVHELTVYARCGLPAAVPLLSAPSEAGSKQTYEVSWSDVNADAYRLQESTTADFANPNTIQPIQALSIELRRSWLQSRTYYYRVAAVNQCFDGSYQGEYSAPVEVRINPVVTSPGVHEYVVLQAVDSGKVNTAWATDVMLFNDNAESEMVALFLLDENANQGLQIEVPPSQAVVIEDVVKYLTTGTSTSSILVGSIRPIMASSHTYAVGENGEFGTFSRALTIRDALVRGETRRPFAYQYNDQNRTSIRITNTDDEMARVKISVVAADGTSIAEWREEVPGFRTVDLHGFAGEEADGGYVSIAAIDYDSWLFATSMVSNQTGGDYVSAVMEGQASPFSEFPRYDMPYSWGWNAAVYGDGVYVVVGPGLIVWSINGESWHEVPIDPDFFIRHLAWNGMEFIAVGRSEVLKSENGQVWTVHPMSADFPSVRDIVWFEDAWIGIANNFTFMHSPDGINWTIEQQIGLGRQAALTTTNDLVVAAGCDTIAYSEDGLIWQSTALPANAGCIGSIAWNGSYLVAVGDSTLKSADGRQWGIVNTDSGYSSQLFWTGEQWLALGNLAATSKDGETWNLVPELDHTYYAPAAIWDGTSVFNPVKFERADWIVPNGLDLMVPVVANSAGRNDSTWISQLGLFQVEEPQPEESTVACWIDLLYSNQANHDPRSVALEVPSNRWLKIDDPLAELFEEQGVAALRLRPENDWLGATSQILNASDDQVYKQQIEALADEDRV